MKIFSKFNIKLFVPWFLLSHIFMTGYDLLDTNPPLDMLLLEKPSVAKTEPVGGKRSDTETKGQGGITAVAEAAEPAAMAAVPAVAGDISGQAPLMQPEDIRAIMETLERKRKALQEEEARLKKERASLDTLKLEIEGKIAELTEVQKKIEADLNQKAALAEQQEKKTEDAESQKIKQLVKVYSSMKAKNAAAIVDKMDMNVVFQVFSNMKGEQVGEILSYVNQDRAAKISEWLATKEKTK